MVFTVMGLLLGLEELQTGTLITEAQLPHLSLEILKKSKNFTSRMSRPIARDQFSL